MGRQDTSFRIIKRISTPEGVNSLQSVEKTIVPSTHLKLNVPFKTEDPKSEYPFQIENNYERIFNSSLFPSFPQHEFRCELGHVLRVLLFSSPHFQCQ